MYKTSIACIPSPPFAASMVVSMRPMHPQLIEVADRTTRPLALAHGAPVHHGDPAEIGISAIESPDFGQSVAFHPGDVPVFWACGVTAIMAAISAASDICITHSPGCMFIADTTAPELLRPRADLTAVPRDFAVYQNSAKIGSEFLGAARAIIAADQIGLLAEDGESLLKDALSAIGKIVWIEIS